MELEAELKQKKIKPEWNISMLEYDGGEDHMFWLFDGNAGGDNKMPHWAHVNGMITRSYTWSSVRVTQYPCELLYKKTT